MQSEDILCTEGLLKLYRNSNIYIEYGYSNYIRSVIQSELILYTEG